MPRLGSNCHALGARRAPRFVHRRPARSTDRAYPRSGIVGTPAPSRRHTQRASSHEDSARQQCARQHAQQQHARRELPLPHHEERGRQLAACGRRERALSRRTPRAPPRARLVFDGHAPRLGPAQPSASRAASRDALSPPSNRPTALTDATVKLSSTPRSRAVNGLTMVDLGAARSGQFEVFRRRLAAVSRFSIRATTAR